MRKWVIAAVAAAALFAVGALAASFSLDAEDVSSGADPVEACGTNATVAWRIDASDAVNPSSTTLANFLVTQAVIDANEGCANTDFALAIQVGTGEVLCEGTFDGSGDATVALSGCDPSGSVNVQQITGAALLIGDANFDLTIINP